MKVNTVTDADLDTMGIKSFWVWKGAIEASPGSNISSAIAEGIKLAGIFAKALTFDFNGVEVTVRYDSDADLIYRDWSRAINGYIAKKVGPYPSADLTPEELAHDAEIEAQNEARRQKSAEEYRLKQDAKKREADARIAIAGDLDLADPEGWQASVEANRDGYGGAVMSYAKRWALLMQSEIKGGKTVAEVAEQTSHDADVEGITGFMYGCAVGILSKCWRHGEELRRWHNKDTQIGDEGDRANENGGVLNPALLSIGDGA